MEVLELWSKQFGKNFLAETVIYLQTLYVILSVKLMNPQFLIYILYTHVHEYSMHLMHMQSHSQPPSDFMFLGQIRDLYIGLVGWQKSLSGWSQTIKFTIGAKAELGRFSMTVYEVEAGIGLGTRLG